MFSGDGAVPMNAAQEIVADQTNAAGKGVDANSNVMEPQPSCSWQFGATKVISFDFSVSIPIIHRELCAF